MTVTDVTDLLDRFVPDQLRRSAIPGAVVVVIKDGKILASKGYGVAEVETGRPMTADRTLMNVASIKKLFEGVAIMQLVEQGRLDLDQDVNAYLDFSITTPSGGVPVTLRRLMTHRAGFEDRFKTSSRSFADLLPYRLFPYGDVPAYSNYGAALSGYILARVSGRPTSDYVMDNVLSPLGMSSSSFSVRPPTALVPLLATGYRVKPGFPPARLDEYFTDLQLYATGDDMGRFIRAVLDGGVIDGRRILRPETLATMMTPQVAAPLSSIGLYFYEHEVGGMRFIMHRGDTGAFQSDLLFQPEAGFALFVTYNAEGDGNPRDDLEEAIIDRYFVRPPKIVSSFAPRPADAEAVAGWYEHTRRSDSNLFSIEELFTQRRVLANPDGSITTGNAGWFVKNPAWTVRHEVAPLIFEAPNGEKWAFETKRGGLEILELADGTSGRERVAWYKIADFAQALMALSFAGLVLGLLFWPAEKLLRRVGTIRLPEDPGFHRRALFVRLVLCLDTAVAIVVVLLVRADWDQRQIFVDALDPWLVALYAAAWLGVLAMSIVVWIACACWRQSAAGRWIRFQFTFIAFATLIAGWIAVVWHIAGTTLNY